jgi:uncharacterized protein (DUF1778 family)
MATRPVKDDRLHVRLTSAQRARVNQAAAAEGRTVTEFALAALAERAEHVLADRRLFELDDAAWESFQALLDRPAQAKPRLAELLARTPPAG